MLRVALKSLSIAAVLVLTTAAASAASYGGVGGRPAYPSTANPRTQSIFIFQLAPGQSAQSGVKVFNTTPDQQTVNLYAVDSVISSGGAFACAQNSAPKNDVGAWVSLGENSIVLAPDSSQVVPFSVSVPNNNHLSVGEHDGCIALQAKSQTATNTKISGVVLSFRSAIRIVVTLPGKIVKKLAIAGSSAKSNKGQIVASTNLVNSGNVSLDTFLTATLNSVFGGKVSSSPQATLPVLPNSKLTQSFNFNRPFWGGFYSVKFAASYNSNPNQELGVNDHGSPKTLAASSGTFFVWPSAGGLAVELLIIIVILGAIFYLVRSWAQKKAVNVNWTTYKVKQGETLESLASSRNVSWRLVAKANKLAPPYALTKGQEIKLPKQKKG